MRLDEIRAVSRDALRCAFMSMTLADEPEAIALTIDVPAEAVAVLEALLPAGA